MTNITSLQIGNNKVHLNKFPDLNNTIDITDRVTTTNTEISFEEDCYLWIYSTFNDGGFHRGVYINDIPYCYAVQYGTPKDLNEPICTSNIVPISKGTYNIRSNFSLSGIATLKIIKCKED